MSVINDPPFSLFIALFSAVISLLIPAVIRANVIENNGLGERRGEKTAKQRKRIERRACLDAIR
jgi:hypothetical protein